MAGGRGGAGRILGTSGGAGRGGLFETEQGAGLNRRVGASGSDARGDRGLGGTDEGGALDEGLTVRGGEDVPSGTAFATLEGEAGRTLSERTDAGRTSLTLTSTFDVTSRRATLIRRGRGGGLRHACGPLVWGWCEHSTLARIILEV
ncbi:conserved hypothetical protein [Frigoribacterium sp. 9N]|nr:conserved hypothetical protein [Frigoribacterium sp. 9N]